MAWIHSLDWELPYAMFVAIKLKKKKKGVPIAAQQRQIQLVTMRLQVRLLASLSGLRSCGVGRRCGLDPALLLQGW